MGQERAVLLHGLADAEEGRPHDEGGEEDGLVVELGQALAEQPPG